MLILDPRTIILLIAVVCALQTATLGLFYRLVAFRYRALAYWIWASVIHGVGFVLLSLRGAIPDFWSVLVANGAFAGTLVVMLAGLNRFLERPRPAQERLAAALALLMLVALIPPTYLAPDVRLRTLVVSLALGALNLLAAWSLARGAGPALRASAWFTAAVLGLNGAWFVGRAVVVALSGPVVSIFDPSFTQQGTYLAIMPALLLWLAGVVALTTQRLLSDLSLAQAAERAALQQAAHEARRWAEEARAREELFRLTFDRSPLGAALIATDGRLLRANAALERITGFDAAALLERDAFALVLPEYRGHARAQARALLDGAERVSSELRGLRADGSTMWLQISAGLVRDGLVAPRHILALVEDITAAKEAAEALRRSNERLEFALWGADLGLWDWHLPSGTMETNPQLARLIGLTPDELSPVVAIWSQHTHPDDLPAVEAAFADAIEGRTDRVDIEFRIRHRSGELRCQAARGRVIERDIDGRAVRLIGVTRDITERRKAEEQLREREALLRSVSDNLPNGVIYQLERSPEGKGRFRYVSAGIEQLWGVSPEAIYADPEALWSQFHPDDRPAFERAARHALETLSRFEFEGRICLPDGSVRWSYSASTPQRQPDGTVLRSGIELDITARKQAETALQRRVQELTLLAQITQALSSWTDRSDGLMTVVALLQPLFADSAICIWEYDDAAQQLLPLVVGEAPPQRPQAAVALRDVQLPQAVLERHAATLRALPPDHPLLAPAAEPAGPPRHALLVPLRARKSLVGLLCISSGEPTQPFTPSDVTIAQTVAGVLGSALDNARLLAQARSSAAAQERRRLARELHDAVSQALFAANRTAEVLPQLWELDPDEGRVALADLHRFTTAALAEMRALLVELRPPALVEAPLHQTLGFLAPTVRARGVAEVQVLLDPAPLLPPDVQVALYRVAQEALNNATKHARPRLVSISLGVDPPPADAAWSGTVTVTVADDGRGFVVAPAAGAQFGLATMRERAAEIGATLRLESAPGGGTRVSISWRGAARLPAAAEAPLAATPMPPAYQPTTPLPQEEG